MCSRWPYWRAWRCQRIPNSRRSVLPPSVPWIQTNDVICSLSPLPHGPFPVTSDGIYHSPILLKVPFVLDTLQCETLLHNLGRRNKSELLLAINTTIEAWRHYREDWSYCGLPCFFFFFISRFLSCELQNNTYNYYSSLYISVILPRRKIQPEILSSRPETKRIDPLTPTESMVKIPTLCSKITAALSFTFKLFIDLI